MCGICAIFSSTLPEFEFRKKLIECSARTRHRGPDWSGYHVEDGAGIAHERLAIINPESGAQPLFSPDKSVIVAANGEIYNYKELYANLPEKYTPVTGSDCEVIIPLYQQLGIDAFPQLLRGMFSFIIYDRRDKTYFAVRDHIGITPLYIGYGADGSTWLCSEMKSLAADCARFQQFPPGTVYSSKTGQFSTWYKPMWREIAVPKTAYDAAAVRNSFISSVKRRMMADVPWGVLLSGGLDSSLVASVACRLMKEAQQQDTTDESTHTTWFPRMHSFCVGLEGSPDINAAAGVAKFLGTVHHSYTYTLQEGLDAISEVIYHLETFDVTTIRASTPMFLMSRRIKAMGIKMVLSGEGSDELFAGYLYFHKAPNAAELQAELRDKVANLHMFDCLRANKATSAWGLEARVPFLDLDFMDVVMNIDPEEKMIREGRIEKHILRQAFDTPDDPFLPHHVLWRQKEQFSDGVGYGWIDSLRDLAEKNVTDLMFKNAKNRFPENTPVTKEAYMYRSIFETHFPQISAVRTVPEGPSIACSTARAMEWDQSFKDRADCSGRAVAGVHDSAYDEKFTFTVMEENNDASNASGGTNGHTAPSKRQKKA